jgi:carboxyl-terminal processing protease
MTTARYYLPSGRSIQASGVNPDVVVRPGKIQFDDEQKVRKEADLRGRLESRGIIIKEETPITEVDDYQLQRALDIIRVLYYYSGMRK